jgi:hypothetical protein
MTIAISLTIMLVLTINGTNNLFAAKKLFEIKLSNVNVNYNFEGTACGVSGDLTVKTHISKFRFVRRDNGHSTFQITFGLPGRPDLDCGDIKARNFKVLSPDPHGFDGDNDWVDCEP